MRLQYAMHVTLFLETRNAFKILVWKSLGKLERRWEYKIKVDINELGCENWR
jgi:hypothetical protein